MIGFSPRPLVYMGKPNEELFVVPTEGMALVPANMVRIKTELNDKLLVHENFAKRIPGNHQKFMVIPDGNRGAIIPDLEVELWNRRFLIGLKGIGARVGMYKDGNEDFSGLIIKHEPLFYSEAWFGENPWGAMSHKGCMEDLGITEQANQDGINGFFICPMVRATPLPEWLMADAHSNYWYRKLESNEAYYQQLRLMPSDVRLFYQSEATLGKRTLAVLNAFKIDSLEELDDFIHNYIHSGIAALTLIPRTLRAGLDSGHFGLDFTDVWLDKDSVIAPDGTIFFADIEGLEWVPIRDEDEAKFKMKRQFERNFYEFMYGIDCLLKERNKMTGQRMSFNGLRQTLAARLELALEQDKFTELEQTKSALYIILKPTLNQFSELKIKILDLEDGGA